MTGAGVCAPSSSPTETAPLQADGVGDECLGCHNACDSCEGDACADHETCNNACDESDVCSTTTMVQKLSEAEAAQSDTAGGFEAASEDSAWEEAQ